MAHPNESPTRNFAIPMKNLNFAEKKRPHHKNMGPYSITAKEPITIVLINKCIRLRCENRPTWGGSFSFIISISSNFHFWRQHTKRKAQTSAIRSPAHHKPNTI